MFAGNKPDVEAVITFLETEEDGRQAPVSSGYRPQFFYRGEHHVAVQEFVGKEQVNPGEEVIARLHFLHPELLQNSLRVGGRFAVMEGDRIVARGSVTRILHLMENAKNMLD